MDIAGVVKVRDCCEQIRKLLKGERVFAIPAVKSQQPQKQELHSVTYHYSSTQEIIIPDVARTAPFETLFVPNEDDQSLQQCVLVSLMKVYSTLLMFIC